VGLPGLMTTIALGVTPLARACSTTDSSSAMLRLHPFSSSYAANKS
jgi:hypothetical protein